MWTQRISLFLCGLVLGLAGTFATAAAFTKEAEGLVAEQVEAGCGGAGTIDPAGVIERDLTGDGKGDLIIDHGRMKCASGEQSGFCGMRACSVLIYVRSGGHLQLHDEVLSAGVRIGAGNPPAIEMMSHDLQAYQVRWNGHEFAGN